MNTFCLEYSALINVLTIIGAVSFLIAGVCAVVFCARRIFDHKQRLYSIEAAIRDQMRVNESVHNRIVSLEDWRNGRSVMWVKPPR